MRDLSPAFDAHSSVLFEASRSWGLRGYYAMFAGLAFLALSKVAVLHWVGFIGAAISCVVAVYMVVMMWVYRRRYVHACQAEGVLPRWRRR